nr:MAG TPA: hypothetical protein [Caudoviricetes sp.]
MRHIKSGEINFSSLSFHLFCYNFWGHFIICIYCNCALNGISP